VTLYSIHGCSIRDPGPIHDYVSTYSIIVGIVIALTGIFFLIFGGRYASLTLGMVITLIFGITNLYLIYEVFLPGYFPAWTVWLAVYAAFGIGAGLGVGGVIYPTYGVGFVGACIGLLFGEILKIIFFWDLEGVGHWVILIYVFGISIGILLAEFLMDFFMIAVSSIIGSYLLFRVSKL
jgi:hypothetical protein